MKVGAFDSGTSPSSQADHPAGRNQSRASAAAAVSTEVALRSSPVTYISSSAGLIRLANRRQKPTTSVTMPTAARSLAGFSDGYVPGTAARAGKHQVHADRLAQVRDGGTKRQECGSELGHRPECRRGGDGRRQAGHRPDVVLVRPQLECPGDEEVARPKRDAVNRDHRVQVGLGGQAERAINGVTPLRRRLLRRPAGLLERGGLG